MAPVAPVPTWRARWASSWRLRFMVAGLAPLLLALPLVLGVLVWLGGARVDALLHSQVQTNLAAAQNHLDQTREHVREQLLALARSERLRVLRGLHLAAPEANGTALPDLLQRLARTAGYDVLVLADSEGRVVAASTNLPAGTVLPNTYVVRLARGGLTASAYTALDAAQARALRLPVPSHPDAPAGALLAMAAVHLPLQTELPNQILVAGTVLNHNNSLLGQMREVVYPVGSLPGGTEGVLALYMGPTLVAGSARNRPDSWLPDPMLAPDVAQHALTDKQVWSGRLRGDGQNHVGGFAPLLDGNGVPVGALGVAFSAAPYQRLSWGMLAAVAGVLALAMVVVSVLFVSTGSGMARYIGRLRRVMTAFREGQRDQRVGDTQGRDELARLSRELDGLLDTLQRREAEQQTLQDELRRTRDHLAREHNELSRVIDGTRAGTWAWNVQTGEVRFNERWAGILGFALAELQPVTIQTWLDLCHPDDLPRSNSELQRHFNGEVAQYDVEVRMRHKAGHWVWVHDRGSLQSRTADGQPEWVHGTHVDVSERHHAEAARQELLDRLQRLSANVPGVLYQFQMDADGRTRFPYASAGMADIYGCTPAEVENDASKVYAVVHPDDLTATTESIVESARQLTPWRHTYRVLHPQRGTLWVEGHATPVRQHDGSTVWHGYIRDMTVQQQDRERLRLAASVFDAAHDGIMITDARHTIVDVNRSFCRITGYSEEEAIGRSSNLLASGRHDEAFYQQMYAALAEHDVWQGEIWNRRKDGELYAELLSIATVRDERGQIGHYVAMFSDITGLKVHEQELDRIAHYDALTGIPNRRLLGDRMRQALARAQRSQLPLAVCMLDLDGFKPVNDTHGHATGDLLLVEVARRLEHCLRAEDTVARLGGDEFVLLLQGHDTAHVFERVLHTLRQPVVLPAATVQVSASMGVAFYRAGVSDGDQLLREADQALYQSKAQGRDRFTVFQAEGTSSFS